MSDTIDLLEAIGRDASLRHASAEELSDMLAQAQASAALTSAAAHGDSSLLSAELGYIPMQTPQITQSPGHEEDEPAPDEEEAPNELPTPEQGNASLLH
ncbi:hypothetical protein [Dyella silvatica]|uniref:hypothetical protein n=1 Tax=Dyella silvatica TaxID=2992128 RepID=UPI002259A022|nr:hypothetical protein [Dyella silvatica]